MDDVLDNPVWAALTGPHASLASSSGGAVSYPPDMCAFSGISGPGAWDDLAELAGPGGRVGMSGPYLDPPPGWGTHFRIAGRQLSGAAVAGAEDPEAVELTTADAAEMLDLVARTDPGPFRKRTVELGRYLGVRRAGALVAMAGERMRLPGWTEISAVCTDPAHRGQGLAGRLVRAVAAGIQARGDKPFLAVAEANTRAFRLYRGLGFTVTREVTFAAFDAPGQPNRAPGMSA